MAPVTHTGSGVENESPSYHTGSSEPPNDLILPPMGGGSVDLTDRRLRRQIANCNERRRMQSINAGFQSLKLLLPRKDGEKLSKAAILQHTVELIQTLRAEKMKLIEEKEAVINAKKRKIEDDSMRERGVIDELTVALENERRLRHLYERMFNLWTNSPMLSHFLSKVNNSMINPALALQNIVPPALQTRGFAGILPPALLINSLLFNARLNNNGSGGNSVSTAEQAQANFELGLLTGNLLAGNSNNSDDNNNNSSNSSCSSSSSISNNSSDIHLDDTKQQLQQMQPTLASDLLAQSSLFNISSLIENGSGNNLNPNLCTILEAIRQLEESGSNLTDDTPNNSSVGQQQANVLVR